MEPVAPAVCIKVIFTLLEGLRFGTTGLSLEERIRAELVIIRRSSSVYLTEVMMGIGPHASLGVRPPYSKESLRLFVLLYPAERGGGES